jgi:hypothetical protein
MLEERPELERDCLSWYAAFLEAMDEQPLYPPAPDRRATYRLLELPTFNLPSMARISEGSHGWEVVGKVTDGRGGLFAGNLVWQGKRALNVHEAARLEQGLHHLPFWSMPVKGDHRGLDGTTWLLEGVQGDRYHVIHRWSPEPGPLVDFGEYLLRVSGVREYRPNPPAQGRLMRALEQAAGEADRMRSEDVRRSNEMASRLAAALAHEGLTCPHCHQQTREIRFTDRGPKAKSLFVCRLCGRSFRPEDLQ